MSLLHVTLSFIRQHFVLMIQAMVCLKSAHRDLQLHPYEKSQHPYEKFIIQTSQTQLHHHYDSIACISTLIAFST